MCLAIPGKIIGLVAENPDLAVVDVSGVRRTIDTGLLSDDPAAPGDWVLIHVGFAMSKVSERDALEQMQTLAALGEDESIMREVQGYGVVEDNESGP